MSDIKGNNLRLFISEAEIKSVTVLTQDRITVGVSLKVAGKDLTDVQLGNLYHQKDTPNEIIYTERMSHLAKELIEEVKKNAIVSLERVQSSLSGTVEEAEVL